MMAYQKWAQENRNIDKKLADLEKYSAEQLFFMNFGHLWCSKMRDSVLAILVKLDTHSPSMYRVIGATSNFIEFDRVFGCKPGQELQWLGSTIQILEIDRFYFYLLDNCSFPQLQSLLYIGNISEYDKWIFKMNLKSLTIWSDESLPHHDTNILIPETVVRFSTYLSVLYINLIDLNIKIKSLKDLMKIVQTTLLAPFERIVYLNFSI
ncbi:hypothetical protein I4U23_017070 [Adineta vaga]|nr:hypothetical protein I4U23_017070 [Adineta vaga]